MPSPLKNEQSAVDRIMKGAGKWRGIYAVCSIRKIHRPSSSFGMILQAEATGKVVRPFYSVGGQGHFI